jgi:hypothetical protein
MKEFIMSEETIYKYYIPPINGSPSLGTFNAPADFLELVAQNTIQYGIEGYIFYIKDRGYSNEEFLQEMQK